MHGYIYLLHENGTISHLSLDDNSSLSNISLLTYFVNSKTTSGKSLPEVVVSVEEELANLLRKKKTKKQKKNKKKNEIKMSAPHLQVPPPKKVRRDPNEIIKPALLFFIFQKKENMWGLILPMLSTPLILGVDLSVYSGWRL